ncbi:MAG TPA: AAA family ATPase [Gaiellaceae bacterium]|jgi:class 3 adenylate cyclase/tetratricopeptide (TPR) repeat protein
MERKLATVLFVDLVGSTALVSSADPEVVRRRVGEYFERSARCIEQHGGTVEKFAGDAVMAAFGVPRTHEDDATRAVRAAFAVLDQVHELGLEARVGVEAGELVVDDSASTFATGEALNLAARLQQAAAPGEIVLGPAVRRLAAGTVEVEDAGLLEVRGRREPLWTWRALRPLDMPKRVSAAWFVGRDEELELLQNALARTVRDGRASLVTVFGEPGIGKSRLVAEFVAGAERVTTLTGRALPYGEGIVYWPLASMIKASAGIADDDPAADAFEKLRLCCESEAVADLLAAALGVLGAAEDAKSADELTWAATRWAEQLAAAQPLVLVFEDVHWAEEPLLDLVEHLARTLRDAPVLIVCVARPDLLELRPSWGGGNARALALELTALSTEESRELVDALLAESEVPPAQRALALEKAEGNPLFLEETARMLVDGEPAALERIPDSVQALIAARIDGLPDDDRRVLQRAALIGRAFWQGAVEALSPGVDAAAALVRLCEREFVASEARSSIGGETAFQFAHGLIREVAYATMSKTQRAEDHRRFAAWVAEHAPDELADARAYHLDAAAALVSELDGSVPPDLAREAAEALEAAGRRAFRRSSFVRARRLLLRAVDLEPTLARRCLAAETAWRLSDVPSVREEAQAVLEDARAEGARDLEGRALVLLAEIALGADGDASVACERAGEALEVLPGDDLQGLHDARSLLARVGWWVGDADTCRRHTDATIELARAMGRKDLEALGLTQLAGIASMEGDEGDANELVARATELARESGSREAIGIARTMAGRCAAEDLDDPDVAEAALREALAAFEEAGAAGRAGWTTAILGGLELRRGNLARAEELLREGVRRLSGTQERGFLVEAQRQLAEALVRGGKLAEAERLAEHARKTVGRDDVWSRASTLHALGLVRAAQGRREEATKLLHGALEIVEPTMYRQFAVQVRRALGALERGAAAPA